MVKYEIGIVQGTTLNFGRTQLANDLHILVRFECSGQLEVGHLTGHTFSGLYSVMGTKLVESVYCEFTKTPTHSSIQSNLNNY